MSSRRFHKVQAFIESELVAGTFPGAGLGVVQHGERLFEHYWVTYCNPSRRDNHLDSGVRYMLYSFSKAISATTLVLAHQRKLIDYDIPLRTYIPEYQGG